MTRSSLRAALGRVRFTLSILVVILIVTLLTNPSFGEISPKMIDRWGFAPRDLFDFGWHRLITSTFLVTNVRSFAQAILTIGLVGGLAEWVAGSRLTAAAFWATNLVSILLESLFFALPLYLIGSTFGKAVYMERGIGVSAAYFGLTAMVSALLPRPWRWLAASLTLGFILSNIVLPHPVSTHTPTRWMDVVAHVIAFVVGYYAPRWGHLRTRRASISSQMSSMIEGDLLQERGTNER